ncbi:uncharacterized protein At3g28850-like [Punica granatum]|uniref:Uncharacterized protein n=2 Tax=Punica granatum TaxID=22663 RepID=A0A2I0HLK6_PUNGR|nr:uncharacterized protein At3g28850-like [Punica granatum]PKI32595.1 hypothetical protein CRG98_046992 [Punica granatum]
MGCSASRPETLLSRNQEDPSLSSSFDSTLSPFNSPKPPRAFSLPTPLVHHPPLREGDTHHLVSLTSTTYGSLHLIDPKIPNVNGQDCPDQLQKAVPTGKTQSLADSEDSASPDSVINTWELMDGLDDADIDSCPKSNSSSNFDRPLEVGAKPSSCRFITFDGPVRKLRDSSEPVEKHPSSQTKPLWKHLSEEALLAKMDPNVVYSYRRALSSRQLGWNQNGSSKPLEESQSLPPRTSPRVDHFRSQLVVAGDDRLLLYFTTLRGIRKTYEDCCSVRMILRSFRVPVDERDISMDSSYRKELEAALGGKALTLPQVFIRGKHIGGAEEIKQLNEAGELAKLLEGLPVRDPGFVCETCGEARFIPCPSCDGSRKVFDEDEDQLRRCLDCNENGLIRCPGCCT